MTNDNISTIDIKYFAQHFKEVNKTLTEKRFCFILGAGASKSSGIRTGAELAKEWLTALTDKIQFDPIEIEAWIQDKKIDINNPAKYYGDIYKMRFHRDADLGYETLIEEMKQAEPSFGYSVLAQILSEPRHNIVITTNFDNLTETALYTYTNEKPVIVGHESLASFARPSIKRPLIAKIHRDLLYHPNNSTEETKQLAGEWTKALDEIFKTHIPIVIGYGGNDGSLMEYLSQTNNCKKIYWCLYNDEVPSNEIINVVKHLEGEFVMSSGFDDIMFELLNVMELPLLNEELETVAKIRADKYLQQAKKILYKKYKSSDPHDVQAINNIISKIKNKVWGDYELIASITKNPEEKDKIYKEGIDKTNSSELMSNYGLFLQNTKMSYDEAESYFKKAVITDPNNPINWCNYALFLHNIRKEYKQAKEYYLKSIEIDPKQAVSLCNYAIFLETICKEYNEAELYFIRSLEINPDYFNSITNYAIFLTNIRNDYDKGEQLYIKGVALYPKEEVIIGNYAIFLHKTRKNNDLAEKYYLSSLDINQNNSAILANYTQFLIEKGDFIIAIEHLKKAFSNKPIEITLLELWFYCFANFYDVYKDETLKNIKELLDKGVRSEGWDFSGNISQAEKQKHPNITLLKKLADAISGKEDADEVLKEI